jgi:hypothetical protein
MGNPRAENCALYHRKARKVPAACSLTREQQFVAPSPFALLAADRSLSHLTPPLLPHLKEIPSISTFVCQVMEPRFSLPDATPRSSKLPIVISGLQIYIYGLEDLKQKEDVEIGVLYLAHNRTRTYKVTEGIGHEVLHRYRTDHRKKRFEMIAVTFNMRNHGDREVGCTPSKFAFQLLT